MRGLSSFRWTRSRDQARSPRMRSGAAPAMVNPPIPETRSYPRFRPIARPRYGGGIPVKMPNSVVISTSERDQFIPVRKCDITDALIEHGQLTDEASKSQFRQVCRMLGAIFHYEYFERLEMLRRDYYYFDPENDPHSRFDAAALDRAYGELMESFSAVLKGANFVEVSHEEVQQEHRKYSLLRVSVRAPIEEFREVRFFRR